jgi:hypothetical protein
MQEFEVQEYNSLFAVHGGGDLGSGGITSDVFKSLIHGDVN